VERLARADLEAILGFLELAYGTAGEEPLPPPVLESLSTVVSCDEVSFTELDRVRRKVIRGVAYRKDGPPSGPGMETFWRLDHQHPLCAQTVAGRFDALKISDFVTSRELHRREIYREWFRPWDTEYELEVGIPSPLWHTKTLVFGRTKARLDFDERDRSIATVLQPHLIQLYRNATLRRRLVDRCREGVVAADLTDREREVLMLVREGKTNSQIAHELWIAHGTVRKHLEHIYRKLGVQSRTAAVARFSGRSD
jgi:DNA-binding CsgD family transcriptional regulator